MANVDVGGFVSIGECVFIGTKATIIPKRKIVQDITIGAGTLVIKNLNKLKQIFKYREDKLNQIFGKI